MSDDELLQDLGGVFGGCRCVAALQQALTRTRACVLELCTGWGRLTAASVRPACGRRERSRASPAARPAAASRPGSEAVDLTLSDEEAVESPAKVPKRTAAGVDFALEGRHKCTRRIVSLPACCLEAAGHVLRAPGLLTTLSW